MTTVRDFYADCHNGAIAEYLGNQDTTLVMGDRYLTVFALHRRGAGGTPLPRLDDCLRH